MVFISRELFESQDVADSLRGAWEQTRYVEGAVEALLRTLRWAKLDYDEGPSPFLSWERACASYPHTLHLAGPEKGGPNEPYFQSERKEVYDRYLEPLIQVGHPLSLSSSRFFPCAIK